MECPLMKRCKKYSKLDDRGGQQENFPPNSHLQENIVDCVWAKFEATHHYAMGIIYECTNWKEKTKEICDKCNGTGYIEE